MIKVLRVDDRMLHGQVAVAWVNYFRIDTILVANEYLLTDATMQMAFKLAAPPDVLLSMKSLEGAVAVINNPKHSLRKIMVITKSIQDAVYICTKTENAIKDVQIGGLRSSAGRKQIDMNSYLNEEDMNSLWKMKDMGIEITMQADPLTKKLTFEEIVKIYNK